MIEQLEKSKVFNIINEPEVRLPFDDIFTIDYNEFYPSTDLFDNDIMLDIPPI